MKRHVLNVIVLALVLGISVLTVGCGASNPGGPSPTPTGFTITPTSASAVVGSAALRFDLSAQASCKVTGGTMSQSGTTVMFQPGNVPGSYKLTCTMGNDSAEATITIVDQVSVPVYESGQGFVAGHGATGGTGPFGLFVLPPGAFSVTPISCSPGINGTLPAPFQPIGCTFSLKLSSGAPDPNGGYEVYYDYRALDGQPVSSAYENRGGKVIHSGETLTMGGLGEIFRPTELRAAPNNTFDSVVLYFRSGGNYVTNAPTGSRLEMPPMHWGAHQ